MHVSKPVNRLGTSSPALYVTIEPQTTWFIVLAASSLAIAFARSRAAVASASCARMRSARDEAVAEEEGASSVGPDDGVGFCLYDPEGSSPGFCTYDSLRHEFLCKRQ